MLSLLMVAGLVSAQATPPAVAPVPAATLLSLSFVSAHGVLSDYQDSYRRGGRPFERPDWTPTGSHPVTHSGGRHVEVDAVFGVGTAHAAGLAQVCGLMRGGRSEGKQLVGAGTVVDGRLTVRVRSTAPLDEGVYVETPTVEWYVDGTAVGRSGPHVVYVTLGTPTSVRDPNEDIVHRYPVPLPPGVTSKRIAAAFALVRRAGAEGSNDTHALVSRLMDLFPGFLLAKGSHYVNDRGGAWPLADAVAESGECQAIVRLVKAVLDIVGAPGRLELVKLYADPDAPTVPIELPWGAEQVPPSHKQMKMTVVGGQRRGLGVGLLASKPEFPDADEANPDYGTCWRVGPISAATARARFSTERLNNFQAALKVTADGSTRYYGGGVGGAAFANKEELFRSAFWGMVWTLLAPFPVQERAAWDAEMTTAMARMGVARPLVPTGPPRGTPAEGFRLMEIIQIYDDDRCR